jgi:hypothetical protein
MHQFVRLTIALSLISGAESILAQSGSLDPAFKNIPFDTWIDQGDQAHIRWTARVLPVELSTHQRLQAKLDIQVDGNELARRRGKGYMVVLVQFSDSENHVYQTHQAVDLQLVKDDIGKSNVSYIPAAFVTPGDYRISLAVFATATGEHSAMRLTLHVNPLKNDPLAGSGRDLPPVEILEPSQPPDDLFLPNIAGRLNLPIETRHQVRVDILVNASPISAGEPSRTEQINNRSLTSLIPALKVVSEATVRNGTLNVALLDLTTQHVMFQQDGVHALDWAKLGPALKEAGPNKIDIHALENRRQNAQFFVSQVSRRIEGGAKGDPLPILIVLSGPMEFASGEDLHPIEIGGKPEAEIFYIRYHWLPERQNINPFQQDPRRARRGSMMQQPGRGPLVEPIDSLERTLKPLQPRLFDVYTPVEFRKALATMLDQISNL